jgi:hypothetical protein
MEENNISIIYICPCISFFISGFYFTNCLSFCKKKFRTEEHNMSSNYKKKVSIRTKIKPIIQMTDEELKHEFEQFNIRHPQITSALNI